MNKIEEIEVDITEQDVVKVYEAIQKMKKVVNDIRPKSYKYYVEDDFMQIEAFVEKLFGGEKEFNRKYKKIIFGDWAED